MKRLIYTLTLGILLGFLLLVTVPVQAGTSVDTTGNTNACGLKGPGLSDRMDRMLDSLEEKGYDVSAIRTALDSGDTETAKTLLREFLQENRDALPEKPDKSTVNTPASRLRHVRGGLVQDSSRTA